MRKLIGSSNVIFAFTFFAIGGIAVFGAPSQYSDRIREPEDFYGLIFLSLLNIAIGLVLLMVGVRILRHQPYSKKATPILWFASILLVLFLLAVVLLDLMGPSDPGSFGLRLLIAPAAALFFSVIYSIVHSQPTDASIGN